MQVTVSFLSGEVIRLPRYTLWHCQGGSAWLSQNASDYTVSSGEKFVVTDPRGAVIEVVNGPLRLSLQQPEPTKFATLTRWLSRLQPLQLQ